MSRDVSKAMEILLRMSDEELEEALTALEKLYETEKDG